jgi:3-oxoacyl-[acyl-carrier-protein] synthase II
MEDSGLPVRDDNRERIAVVIGSGIGGLPIIEETQKKYLQSGPRVISPFFITALIANEAAGNVSIRYGLKGPNLSTVTACTTGAHAVGEAYRMIQYGDADAAIAGGTESVITPLAVGGFAVMRALSTRNDDPEHASRPWDRDRDGFVMGEGAGLVVLEEMEAAKKRGARIYAELVGYGLTCDAHHMTASHPEGEGAARAMRLALDDAGLRPEDVSYISAHGTGTPTNDRFETLAVKKVFGEAAYRVPVSSVKSMLGHTMGAASAIETAICALAVDRGRIPPTINYETPDAACDLDYVPNQARELQVDVAMNNAYAFGGNNASVIFRKHHP